MSQSKESVTSSPLSFIFPPHFNKNAEKMSKIFKLKRNFLIKVVVTEVKVVKEETKRCYRMKKTSIFLKVMSS